MKNTEYIKISVLLLRLCAKIKTKAFAFHVKTGYSKPKANTLQALLGFLCLFTKYSHNFIFQ